MLPAFLILSCLLTKKIIFLTQRYKSFIQNRKRGTQKSKSMVPVNTKLVHTKTKNELEQAGTS